MPDCINTRLDEALPMLQICDASSGSVRMAWNHPRQEPALSEEDRLLSELRRVEAAHELFRRRFMRITAQYLRGELNEREGLRPAPRGQS